MKMVKCQSTLLYERNAIGCFRVPSCQKKYIRVLEASFFPKLIIKTESKRVHIALFISSHVIMDLESKMSFFFQFNPLTSCFSGILFRNLFQIYLFCIIVVSKKYLNFQLVLNFPRGEINFVVCKRFRFRGTKLKKK